MASADKVPERAHRQHDVVEHGEFRQQEMKLEHEAEQRQPREGALFLVHMRGGAAADQHLAGGRQVEQAEQIEQRRFAGAGRAGDGDEFIVADGQIDVVHQRGRHDAGQDAGDVARLDQRHRRVRGRFALRAARRAHVAPRMISTGCTRAALRAG